jgi:hypothetical protein
MILLKELHSVRRDRPSDSFWFYVSGFPKYTGKHPTSYSAHPHSYVSGPSFRPEITPLHCTLKPKTLYLSVPCHTIHLSVRPCKCKHLYSECFTRFVRIFDSDCHTFETFPSISMSIGNYKFCLFSFRADRITF